ncbi:MULTISPECIES: anti-CBASS protein Acb1 family protein [unclassified Gilliamella]|uniref:anti-CBASS protein Acb1 family protein n=1 Tax=unclassified Gilliamella TaxID=2685620 RepID=UPI0009BE9986|nr:anti-CBASS Acb1 family protein [Gilliamella apicola]
MSYTKLTDEQLLNSAQMAINSNLDVQRQRLAYASHGLMNNSKRAYIDREFGYPENLSFNDYYKLYKRNSAARGFVERLSDICWMDYPKFIDGDIREQDTKLTAWEKIVTDLFNDKLWPSIIEADKRGIVGRYAGLIIQLRDGKKWDEPVDVNVMNRLNPVDAIVKIIPAWEEQLTACEWNNDESDENYGQVTMYQFNEASIGNNSGKPNLSRRIHPDRVIILNETSVINSIDDGESQLEVGYNDLIDMMKYSGGSAEGFLKNASRQVHVNYDADTDMDELERELRRRGFEQPADALNKQISLLNSGTDSALITSGATANILSVSPADPSSGWTVSANSFAASVRMPFTIIFGQQTGRLASDEDKADYAKRGMSRRNGFLTALIKNLINHLIKLRVIEPLKNGVLTLKWSDLLAPSQADRIEVMLKMSDVNVKAQQSMGIPVFTPNEIRDAGGYEPDPDLEDIDIEEAETDKTDSEKSDTTEK